MKPSLLAIAFLGIAGAVAPVTGCSITGEPFSGPSSTSVIKNPYGPDGGDVDAAVAPGSSSSGGGQSDGATWGNPLCRLATAYGDGGLYGCNPDQPATPIDCAMDGGAAAGDAGTGYACRVQPTTNSSSAPTSPVTLCSPISGDAIGGAACKTSDDCAPTYDCVGTPGTCRHYCCAGNSACDSGQFCDVQRLTRATATPIPVCMPITPCSLQEQLAADSQACPITQTCAVVREDGTTGCVDVGGAGPGQSCELDHCKSGLVCLGAPGQRVCYTLCDTQTNSCTAPATCQGGLPLFQDPSVGVCRE